MTLLPFVKARAVDNMSSLYEVEVWELSVFVTKWQKVNHEWSKQLVFKRQK